MDTWSSFSLIFFAFNLLFQILALSVAPSRYRATIFVPLIVFTAILSHWAPGGDDPHVIYALGSHWPTYISTIDCLLFGTAETRYWPKDLKPREAAQWAFGWRKIWWSMRLFSNPRGIGWNFHVKNAMSTKKGEPRLRFIIRRLAWAVVVMVVYDFCHTLVVLGYHQGGGVYTSTRKGGWSFEGLVRKGAIAYVNFAGIEVNHINASVAAVALGLSNPEDWPPLFGRLADLTTVQRFWGSSWHQIIRRTLKAYSNASLQFLRISPDSYLGHFISLAVCFTITGFGHALPLRVMPNMKYTLPLGIVQFYLLQGLAIFLEACVINKYRAITGDQATGGWRRILGHVWVALWFATVGPLFWDDMFRSGMMDGSSLPFSIAGWCIRRLKSD